MKSGVTAKLTWTKFILQVFGAQERGLYPSKTPFFPFFYLLTLKTFTDCVRLVPACIPHGGAAAVGRVGHLTH